MEVNKPDTREGYLIAVLPSIKDNIIRKKEKKERLN